MGAYACIQAWNRLQNLPTLWPGCLTWSFWVTKLCSDDPGILVETPTKLSACFKPGLDIYTYSSTMSGLTGYFLNCSKTPLHSNSLRMFTAVKCQPYNYIYNKESGHGQLYISYVHSILCSSNHYLTTSEFMSIPILVTHNNILNTKISPL